MKPNVSKYINFLEGFKTAIKNLHWSSKNMSEHKLWDDIAGSVADIQDSISEICQGIYGQFKDNELKPIKYTIKAHEKSLEELSSVSKKFYSTLKGNSFIGVRSEMENFIGKIDKYKYLMRLALNERKMDKIIDKIIKENVDNGMEDEYYLDYAMGCPMEYNDDYGYDEWIESEENDYNNSIDSLPDTMEDLAVRDDNEYYSQFNECSGKNPIKLNERTLRKIIKKAIMESEYTCDKFAQEQEDLAFKNGERGNYSEEATYIEFSDGDKFELDDRYDDIDQIKQGLAKDGYQEGRDYKIVTRMVSRSWSV